MSTVTPQIGLEVAKVPLHDEFIGPLCDSLALECQGFASASGLRKLPDNEVLLLVLEVLLDGCQDLIVCRPRVAGDATNVIGSIDINPTAYGVLAQAAKNRMLLLLDGDVDV